MFGVFNSSCDVTEIQCNYNVSCKYKHCEILVIPKILDFIAKAWYMDNLCKGKEMKSNSNFKNNVLNFQLVIAT